jgi:hypothetical protein
MKTIRIDLTPDDLAVLLHLVGEKEKEIHQTTLASNLSLNITGKLTARLNDSQREATIRVQVKAAIYRLTGIPTDQISDKASSTKDLHMTGLQIRSLAIPITYIARQFKKDATISPDECEELDSVDEYVDLIVEKTT